MTNLEHIKELLAYWEQPDYRYRQICEAVFRQRLSRFQEMTMLPRELRQKLEQALGETVLTLRPTKENRSDQAEKVLFALPGQESAVEAVRLHYKKGWDSYCISSQAGCRFGCKFCATGAMGTCRDLTAGEILDQLLYFYLKGCTLSSVSFMGMGEPFANPQLFTALGLLTDPQLFGLSRRRITVSTVGVIPGIHRLTAEWPQVNLAYSLHAPTAKLREKLMPVEKKWPMEQVLEALDEHIRKTRRRVFLAYTLLRDVNDSPSHAQELARLLQQHSKALPLYHVDLIPYNETEHARGAFQAPRHGDSERFGSILRQEGISCSVRTQFGADISAACGQLCGD